MSEPTAAFAVGEFAEAVEDRRRSEDRKSVVPALEFLSHPVPTYPKQEFLCNLLFFFEKFCAI